MNEALKEGMTGPITRLSLAAKEACRTAASADRLRQGRGLPPYARTTDRPREVGCLPALLFRPPRLPADDVKRFLADLRAQLIKGDKALEDKLLLDQWVYQPGLPANVARPDPQAFATVDQAVAAYAAGGPPPGFAKWTTAEAALPQHASAQAAEAKARRAWPATPAQHRRQQRSAVRLAGAGGPEPLRDPAIPALERFLSRSGRQFVLPLFKALAKDTSWGLPIAKRLYPTVSPGYHLRHHRSVDELKFG